MDSWGFINLEVERRETSERERESVAGFNKWMKLHRRDVAKTSKTSRRSPFLGIARTACLDMCV